MKEILQNYIPYNSQEAHDNYAKKTGRKRYSDQRE